MVITAALSGPAAASTAASPPALDEGEPWMLCVNLVCIEGEEFELYQAVEAGLAEELRFGLEPEAEIEIVRRVVQLIDGLPLEERFRLTLRQKLPPLIIDRSSSLQQLVMDLIESSLPRLQDVGLNVLFSLEAVSGELRAFLLETVSDSRTRVATRQAVLWWFHQAEAFAEVEDAALRLALEESEPELAHEAARVLLEDLAQRPGGYARILELYRSTSFILRSRAALAILDEGLAEESSPLRREAVLVVGELAKAADQPASARGEAIKELSLYGNAGKQPQRAILLELLDHRHWFFGASGAHFPVHSLALVIHGLTGTGDPEITTALKELRPLLPSLRSGEREYVEWVLDNALGGSREIFAGPTDPEAERN